MLFGSGSSSLSALGDAARDAARRAMGAFQEQTPKLAIVFASVAYGELGTIAAAVRGVTGPVPVVGGSSAGALTGGGGSARGKAVSVVLLGGEDLEVFVQTSTVRSADLIELVDDAERVAEAADLADRRGFGHFTALVFAPSMAVDGEAVVAAARKGLGARAQLAGGLMGDDPSEPRSRVLAGDLAQGNLVVLAGLFSRHPIGVAAHHGCVPSGPVHTVTRADGVHVLELDGRPAIEVWAADAHKAGIALPRDPNQLARHLANHAQLGIVAGKAFVARAPVAVRADGSVRLSASVPEGTRVRVLRATSDELLAAARRAAREAQGGIERNTRVVGGLVLSSAARAAALGDAFDEEGQAIAQVLGAPTGGASVDGEIARNVRDLDAFFNASVVVVAFGA